MRTWPHCGHTLVMRLPKAAPGGLSLTMRYKISPKMLRKKTIIAHRTPFIPRDSASWYTQKRMRIPIKNQAIGINSMNGRNKKENICWIIDNIIILGYLCLVMLLMA